MTSTQYSITARPGQKYVGSKHRVPMTGISGLAAQVGPLFALLDSKGVQPSGPPFFRYCSVPHTMDDESRFEIDVGIPIPDSAQIQGLESSMDVYVLPSGKHLETRYTGHPSGLGGATRELLKWAEEHDFEFDIARGSSADVWKGRMEWYETDPEEEPDTNKWVTRLSFLLVSNEVKD